MQMPGWNGSNILSTLNKSNCYACAHGRPEAQIVPFPLRWSSSRPGVGCMVALFQDSTAWSNKSCQALSLLYPKVWHPAGQPPRAIQLLSPNTKFTSCLSQQEGNLAFLGDLKGCSELKNFRNLSFSQPLFIPADVWWYCGGLYWTLCQITGMALVLYSNWLSLSPWHFINQRKEK
uniref:Uncharacterized protein n=1 Tax=Macaca fascicularis TaxID=9541 RepID=A0A7N9CXR4_MACFA